MYAYKISSDNGWKIITGVVTTIISLLILLAITFSSGNKIVVRDDKIDIVGISTVSIIKEDIIEIVLLDEMPNIVKKLQGFSEAFISLYKLDNGEEAYVYKKVSEGPFIKIITEERNIYLSFGNEETKETYNNLEIFINEK